MIFFWQMSLLLAAAITGMSADLRECKYCTDNAAHCTVGHTVQNGCVTCECTANHSYSCQASAPTCKHDAENNTSSNKGVSCTASMVYELQHVTCMCTQRGFWPHDKCGLTFGQLPPPAGSHDHTNSPSTPSHSDKAAIHSNSHGSIYNKISIPKHKENLNLSSDHAEVRSKRTTCPANTYVIQDCNVCRCDAHGVIGRCTRNDCSKVVRRTIDNVPGHCEPGTWYSLAPCQFCYCQLANKLTCTTEAARADQPLQLGAYNLTVCSKNLLHNIQQLIADVKNPLPSYEDTPSVPLPTTPPTEPSDTVTFYAMQAPSEQYSSITPSVDYEISSEEGNYTQQPLPEFSAESEDSVEENDELKTEWNSNELVIEGRNENNAEHASPPVKKTQVRSLPVGAPIPTKTEGEVAKDAPLTVESSMDLTSMLKDLVKLALRRAMVRLTGTHCKPGTTSRHQCNYCYCLTNGNQLCTENDCNNNNE